MSCAHESIVARLLAARPADVPITGTPLLPARPRTLHRAEGGRRAFTIVVDPVLLRPSPIYHYHAGPGLATRLGRLEGSMSKLVRGSARARRSARAGWSARAHEAARAR